MNIYVGNLSREITEDELKMAFEEFGEVESAHIIKDKYSGESKGFGFVQMPSKDEAQSAIDNMNGKELQGRTLNVNEARPRTEKRSGSGGYGRGGKSGGRGAFGGGGKGGGRGGFGGGGKGGGRGAFGGGGKGSSRSGYGGGREGNR
jgi:RNA recognition motif-containing protein